MARKRERQQQVAESNMKKRKMEETSDEHKWKYAVDQYHGENPFEAKKDLHPLLHEVARATGVFLLTFDFMCLCPRQSNGKLAELPKRSFASESV